jgi:putative molybdopterin biosynthesis protein
MINREKGCGTRVLLDQKLMLSGINPLSVNGYNRESTSHLACASTVAKGGADVACGCEKGASGLVNVDFIPLQQEWYDLAFRAEDRFAPLVSDVLNYAASREFKNDLEALGGYDVSQTGVFF